MSKFGTFFSGGSTRTCLDNFWESPRVHFRRRTGRIFPVVGSAVNQYEIPAFASHGLASRSRCSMLGGGLFKTVLGYYLPLTHHNSRRQWEIVIMAPCSTWTQWSNLL